jgi:cardiolipin synthase
MLKHLPNLLTLFRIALIPVFVRVFFSGEPNAYGWAFFVYALAGFTDVLDGIIARRFHLQSKLGTVLDPLADKLMLLTVLLTLYVADLIPLIILLVPLAKELFMIGGGIYLYFIREERVVIPSNIFGKLSTVMFFLAITTVLLLDAETIVRVLLYLAVASQLVAFASYAHHYATKVKGGDQA